MHNTTHIGEELFLCDTCGKCFQQLGKLKNHERIYTGEKPYQFKTCEKSVKIYVKRLNRVPQSLLYDKKNVKNCVKLRKFTLRNFGNILMCVL